MALPQLGKATTNLARTLSAPAIQPVSGAISTLRNPMSAMDLPPILSAAGGFVQDASSGLFLPRRLSGQSVNKTENKLESIEKNTDETQETLGDGIPAMVKILSRIEANTRGPSEEDIMEARRRSALLAAKSDAARSSESGGSGILSSVLDTIGDFALGRGLMGMAGGKPSKDDPKGKPKRKPKGGPKSKGPGFIPFIPTKGSALGLAGKLFAVFTVMDSVDDALDAFFTDVERPVEDRLVDSVQAAASSALQTASFNTLSDEEADKLTRDFGNLTTDILRQATGAANDYLMNTSFEEMYGDFDQFMGQFAIDGPYGAVMLTNAESMPPGLRKTFRRMFGIHREDTPENRQKERDREMTRYQERGKFEGMYTLQNMFPFLDFESASPETAAAFEMFRREEALDKRIDDALEQKRIDAVFEKAARGARRDIAAANEDLAFLNLMFNAGVDVAGGMISDVLSSPTTVGALQAASGSMTGSIGMLPPTIIIIPAQASGGGGNMTQINYNQSQIAGQSPVTPNMSREPAFDEESNRR